MKFLRTQNLKRYIKTYKCYEYIKKYNSPKEKNKREITAKIRGRSCGKSQTYFMMTIHEQSKLIEFKQELKTVK